MRIQKAGEQGQQAAGHARAVEVGREGYPVDWGNRGARRLGVGAIGRSVVLVRYTEGKSATFGHFPTIQRRSVPALEFAHRVSVLVSLCKVYLRPRESIVRTTRRRP